MSDRVLGGYVLIHETAEDPAQCLLRLTMVLAAVLVATLALFAQTSRASYSGVHGGYGGYGHDARYHGPQALPVVLADGHIADTHEVATAKSAHLKAVGIAATHSGYGHGGYDDGSYAGGYGYGGYAGAHGGYAGAHGGYAGAHGGYAGAHGGYAGAHGGYAGAHGGYAHDGPRYHGPIAIPVVLPDGHIADTHEVAAAKEAHYSAVAKAKAHSGYGAGYDGYGGYAGHGGYAGTHGGYAGAHGGYAGAHGGYAGGYGHAAPYHGPLAKPVVLPSGYLADTHDVAALKGAHLNALAHASHSHAGWAPHGHGFH